MDNKLCGVYNLIICNECGAAASIIFDHLINNYENYVDCEFYFDDLAENLVFMKKNELKHGLISLEKHGYISGGHYELMELTTKSLFFAPNKNVQWREK